MEMETSNDKITCLQGKYQPSGAGGTRSPPATPHRLQNPKWPPAGPKMADGVWKGVHPSALGHSKQLSLNRFFDLRTPSMRKVDDGEKRKKKIMTFIVATNVIASRPPERRPTGTPHARAKNIVISDIGSPPLPLE